MKFSGRCTFLGARHQEAKGDFPAAWFINVADDDGDSMSFRAKDEVLTFARVPERLADVDVVVEVMDKPPYGDRPAKRDVQIVSIVPVAAAKPQPKAGAAVT